MGCWLEASCGAVAMGICVGWSVVETEGGHTPWIIGGTNTVAGSYVSALSVDA